MPVVSQEIFDCRDAFAQTLEELAKNDEEVVTVCNDSVGSSKLVKFKEKFPDRLINVGIAEQNMVGVGTGLANGGKIPFVCSASCFLTGRALEQIKTDIAYSNVNVKLCGMSSGMAYGELGPTHHSVEDIAWMRLLPNLTILVPADRYETAAAIKYAYQNKGPLFIRISRMKVPDIYHHQDDFQFEKADVLKKGSDITLIANGVLVHRVLQAGYELEKYGISARVINLSCVAPIDHQSIIDAARETGAIITCEEHSVYGGIGGSVAEIIVQSIPVPMKILGVPGVFSVTGSAEWLLERYRMSIDSIIEISIELYENKSRK